MSKYFISLVFISALTGTVHSQTITFDPDSINVVEGTTFAVDIVGQGFSGTEGGGAEFTFDPAKLQIISISIDSAVWEIFDGSGTIDNEAGLVEGIAVATFNNPGTNFVVATVEILADSAGTISLELSENPSNPWANGGSEIGPALVNGEISVEEGVNIPMLPWVGTLILCGMLFSVYRSTKGQ